MAELKIEGKANILRTAVAVDDPGDQFKTLRSLKIEAIVDARVINALLGIDAELFWQDTEQLDVRWFAIKKVVLDIAVTKHECCLGGLDLGDVVLKGFEFLPVGTGRAELAFTIYPSTPPPAAVADKLQQAVNRTQVDVAIWRKPEPATDQLFAGDTRQ